jgi:hypothetical protein
VEIALPNGKRLVNHATTSVGYASSSEPLVRFGLGAEPSVKLIRIRWPGGQVDEMRDVKPDRVLLVKEGSAPATVH